VKFGLVFAALIIGGCSAPERPALRFAHNLWPGYFPITLARELDPRHHCCGGTHPPPATHDRNTARRRWQETIGWVLERLNSPMGARMVYATK